MEYIEAINKFRDIEDKYDVMSIKYKGVSIWPFLRIYLFDSIATHNAVEYSSSILLIVLKSLFQFNPLKFFKHYKIWDYAASITRKRIGDKYEHHVSGYLHKSGYPVLTVEFPSPGARGIKREEIPEKNIVSASWSLLLTAFIDILYRPLSRKIKNEDLLKKIIIELGVDFNYKMRLRRLCAQKKAKDIILAIGHKPKLVILECYYTNMGNIWSFHNHGIPVIELQHGVVNNKHYAYNCKFHSEELYPDEFCVYGIEEYDYFTHKETPFSNVVTQTGVYILESSDNYFRNDLFEKFRKEYNKIIVVAGETVIEDKLSAFIDEAAKMLPHCFFVYIPRRKSDLHFESHNVKFVFGVNIYEYLKWCDVHVTHASTTGLEAHYFRKPVIYCDFEGVAFEYYGKVINEKNGAFYVHTLEEFVDKIEKIDNRSYEYRELFAHNSEKRLAEVLERHLSKIK